MLNIGLENNLLTPPISGVFCFIIYLFYMKILITKKQQKLIKENFYEDQKYRMFIDMLGLMIDNYDSIDCENPVEKIRNNVL